MSERRKGSFGGGIREKKMHNKNEHKKFSQLAKESRGLVGGLGKDFNESLAILAEIEGVEYEFHRLGDTIARAYWHELDKDGELVGGCVAIVSKNVDY